MGHTLSSSIATTMTFATLDAYEINMCVRLGYGPHVDDCVLRK